MTKSSKLCLATACIPLTKSQTNFLKKQWFKHCAAGKCGVIAIQPAIAVPLMKNEMVFSFLSQEFSKKLVSFLNHHGFES